MVKRSGPENPKKILLNLPDAAYIVIHRNANNCILTRTKRPQLAKKTLLPPSYYRHSRVTCTGRVQYPENLRSRKQ